MNSCKITIQRKVGEQWPVVLEQRTADAALEIRTVGSLSLDVLALSAQVTPRDYGMMLGQALFQGSVREAFLHARAQSNDQLSVQLLVEAPDLSTLRWERLCAPLDEHWHFLAHDQRAPLSLAPSSPSTRRFPLLRRVNLRALVLVASPQGLARYRLSPFNVEDTVASVRSAFGSIPCDVLSTTPDAVGPPTLDTLCERLSSTSYSLLHVVCHGRYSSDISDTVIYLANEEQQVDPVTGQRLITRLAQLRGEQGLPQFAFLATCESASPEAEGVLGGLAQSLVRDLGMPAVLAMTETVSISTIDAVTSQFYRRLVAHGQVDLALAEACAGVAERADSLVPALYSRLGARPLFDQQARAADPQPLSLTHQKRKQNRARMLERIQRIWIGDVLEQSLHDSALLTLGLQEQPDAVTDPWRQVVQEAEQPVRSLPPGTRITQVYDRADHELLILGAPGAGKTTLLLELTRNLLQRAKLDDTHPIPVVFHLSSWAVKRQPLKQWLMEELNLKYQVPRKLAQEWVDADHILPLLDGLDEVTPVLRAACIDTINAYRDAHGLVPMVVCSRSTDYLAQKTPLLLRSAVVVQPLTGHQIDNYLSSTNEQLTAMRVALRDDPKLRELVATPLMLSILVLAYHGKPVEDLLAAPPETRRQLIFKTYVQSMFEHRSVETRYTPQQTVHWLTWLARQMIQHSQTVFYIERMQPDWLSEGQWHQQYPRYVTGLIFGLVGLLAIGPISGIFFTSFSSLNPSLSSILVFGLLFGLVCGPLFGLLNGFLYKLETERRLTKRVWWSWESIRRRTVRGVLNGLLVGLVLGLPIGLHQGGGLAFGLDVGVLGGLFGGLGFALIDGLISGQMTEIQPAEVFVWSWMSMGRSLVKSLFFGLLCSLLIGLLSGLFFGLFEWASAITDNVLSALPLGLRIGLQFGQQVGPFFVILGGLLGGLKGGLSHNILDKGKLITPNQGIHRSARYSVLIGLVGGLIGGLVGGLIGGLGSGQGGRLDTLLLFGLISGLPSGLIIGLYSGAGACIQHLVLRFFLRRTNSMPWNYPRFLDYAAERILLQKVGGGYMFIHRQFLEYFATQNSMQTSEDVVTRVDEEQYPISSHSETPRPTPPLQRGASSAEHRVPRRTIIIGLLSAGVVGGGGFIWWLLTLRPLYVYRGHSDPVDAVAWSPDGKRIASASFDKTVQVWNATNGNHVYTYRGHSDSVNTVAWSPDSKRIASGGIDATVQVWNATNGAKRYIYKGHSDPVDAVAWSLDGKHIVSASFDQTVQVWNAADGGHVYTYRGHANNNPNGFVNAVAWSPDGKRIASASSDQTVQVWNAADGGHVYTYRGHASEVNAVAWSPDGKRIASASWDRTVQVWNAADGSHISSYWGANAIRAVAWSPDGRRIALGNDNSLVEIWSAG